MKSPYKRRRPMLLRTGWEYRKLIALALALGVLLWFIWVNNTPVEVKLPFWLSPIQTTSGLAILLGALAGSIVTGLGMAVFLAIRRHRREVPEVEEAPGALPEDLPPADYGAKTGEGFSDAPWSAR